MDSPANPARPLINLRFDGEKLLERRFWFVYPRYILTIFVVVITVVGWVLKEVTPAAVEKILPPVVYRSHVTKEITRVMIGDRVYTPDADPEWETHKKLALSGSYESEWDK